MNREKPDKRKEQGAKTKRRLYEISERLFSDHDYIDVSVEDTPARRGSPRVPSMCILNPRKH